MATIFEKISQRELPAYIVWEDTDFIAFLNIRPAWKGHTLVVPKKAWSDEVFELDNEKYLQLWGAAKEVANKLKKKFQALRIVSWVEGFEVPHVHIHLIPATAGFSLKNMTENEALPEELEKVYTFITSS